MTFALMLAVGRGMAFCFMKRLSVGDERVGAMRRTLFPFPFPLFPFPLPLFPLPFP